MKLKTYKLSILTLALVFVFALSSFIAFHFLPAEASAPIQVSGTNVFTSTGDANVIANAEGEGDDQKHYTMFTFAYDDDSVSYRRNLAYNWFEPDAEDLSGALGVNKMFNMEIGFESVTFEKFVITFESQQFTRTKENKTVNYVMFFPAEEEGKVNVLVTDDEDATKDNLTDTTAIDYDRITIEFTQKLSGSYSVEIGNDDASVSASLENVGGNYARASTSSSPVYPLIFKSYFGEETEREAAKMVMYSLNGQAFEVENPNYNSAEDYYFGGNVQDNTAPVLCLNDDISYLELGEEIDADFQVIDVLRTTVHDTLYYYVLEYAQYKDEDLFDLNDKELFEEVENDRLLESDIDKYLPTADVLEGTAFGSYNMAYTPENGNLKAKLKADMLAKVYINIKDASGSNAEERDIYLDWYVRDEYKVNIKNTPFIAVATDDLGATYNYEGKDGKTWDEIKDEYQEKVDEAAENLSAGSSSYFYLPSVEDLFADNATAYTDLRFSVYFYHSSQQSNTNNAYNNLSINVSQQGAYTFTVYATDAAGNNMYYIDDDGEIKEFATGEIWTMFGDREENGLYYKLPWFHFDVGYTGASFDEVPGAQATAYVGTRYSSARFDINGVSGSYDTNYRLFLFDRARYFAEEGRSFTYEEFIDAMDELFDNPDTRGYFTEIPEVNESDANYDEYKDYNWHNNATSFTPQVANGLYMIRAELTDRQYNTDPVTCSLAVIASMNSRTISGESDWLENNVASVVLLSVAGLALIGIIVLLVIKPKDKADIDEEFEKQKKNNKK